MHVSLVPFFALMGHLLKFTQRRLLCTTFLDRIYLSARFIVQSIEAWLVVRSLIVLVAALRGLKGNES